MKKRKLISSHNLTELDLDFLRNTSAKATPAFVRSMSIFLTGCQSKGYSNKVAAAAFSAWMLENLVKLLALASGIPADALDSDAIGDITNKSQEALATLVSAYIDKENLRESAEFN